MSQIVYVALGAASKVSVYALDEDAGRLHLLEDVPLSGNPGPLVVDPVGDHLYVGVRSIPELAAFRIDRRTGRFSLIGSTPLAADPCYLSMDRRGRFLLSAHYRGGLAAVHAIGQDGAVAAPPVAWCPTARGAHCIETDPSNRYAFVPHVAESNAIFQFLFDAETGRLTPNPVPRVEPTEPIGPRHYVFHPRQNLLYCDNEQGSSLTVYRLDPDSGRLHALQTLSTLPAGFCGENSCAQIHLHPSGRFVYASNRGHDSIAGFRIDPDSGLLTAIGQYPTEPVPRAFNLDVSGRYLFAGGQTSGRLAAYRVDPEGGGLTALETYEVGANAMWILPFELGA